MGHPNQLAPSVAFLHLTVDQLRCHLPLAHVAPATTHLEPLAKVGRERIKVEIEPVTREERDAARSQALSERVDEDMRHVLRAGAELKHRKNLGERVDGKREPEHLCDAAEACAQFIQLQVWEPEMAEEAFVQSLCVCPCTSEPRSDGDLSVAENPLGRGWVKPFGQRSQNHGDLV